MKKQLIAFVLTMGSLAACTSSTSDTVDPTGNWDVTLTWTTTPPDQNACVFNAATFNINFDVEITPAGDAYSLTALEGLTGDQVGGTMTCTATLCTLDFMDSGPGSEFSNIQMQTISATLDVDAGGTVTGTGVPAGTATFVLTDGSNCAADFDAAGDVI